MADTRFKPGQSGNPKGRPKMDHRKYFEAALTQYGSEKFWKETFEKAKHDASIRSVLIRKMLPDLQEHSGTDGGPLVVKVTYAD